MPPTTTQTRSARLAAAAHRFERLVGRSLEVVQVGPATRAVRVEELLNDAALAKDDLRRRLALLCPLDAAERGLAVEHVIETWDRWYEVSLVEDDLDADNEAMKLLGELDLAIRDMVTPAVSR